MSEQRRPAAARHPGDLSRRLAARRGELGLSAEAVAARAGIHPGYLRHLEDHATMPTWATLRSLAAALETTPGRLLGDLTSSRSAP